MSPAPATPGRSASDDPCPLGVAAYPFRITLLHQSPVGEDFRHEALLYEGTDDFVARTVPFIREGLRGEEPVMVAVAPAKIDLLREALDGDGDEVHFADITDMGRNPACIIPAWRSFLTERQRPGAAVRGIGEPIWLGREPAELVESQLHEALLNLAFADSERFRLLCPYDVETLSAEVVHEARCSHPFVCDGTSSHASREYRGADAVVAPFDAPLPPPTSSPELLGIERATLTEVRHVVIRRAEQAGLGRAKGTDLALAVHELATNSLRHGGGNGVLRVWRDGAALVCEVRDSGHIHDRLAGRHDPTEAQANGRGLRIANQLCDLVQIRSSVAGTVVRVSVS